MTVDQRDKIGSYAGFWISIAMLVGGSANNAWFGNYTQAGAGIAMVSGLFCLRIGLRMMAASHDLKMKRYQAKLEEIQAEVRRSQANAQMGEMALASMQKHIDEGGGFAVTSDIPIPRRGGPAH